MRRRELVLVGFEMALLACAGDRARQTVDLPAPAPEQRDALDEGLRLVYDVEPNDRTSREEAAKVLRARLARQMPAVKHAVRVEGERIVVELAPMSGADLAGKKTLLTVAARLRVAPSRDEGDPLRALAQLGAPHHADFAARTESIGLGTVVQHVTYVSGPATPSYPAAKQRLLAWLREVAPDVRGVVCGPTLEDTGGEGVRTYVLGSEPVELAVQTAEATALGIEMRLTGASAALFADATRRSVNRRLLVLVGEDVKIAPIVVSPIESGRMVLAGKGKDDPEAVALALHLTLPPLRARLTLAEEDRFGR